jgi:3-oxoacyl-(acyl-carrier-protein) synthase
MKVYIRSAGIISPQHSLEKELFFSRRIMPSGIRMPALEPDYARYVDTKMIRRMSRIVRMGVAAAMECLRQGGIQMPGAIITGTAFGCMEDTGIFLRRMIDNQEELLTPTAFIQSTHNTVGAQIALLLKCHAYNNTIVHRGFSFENALLDASLLLREGTDNILTGAVDEITEDSHAILTRFGIYKKEPSPHSLDDPGKGTFAGEGASFFVLSSQNNPGSLAEIKRVETLYKPKHFADVEERIHRMLRESSLTMDDVDLIITGHNGDTAHDQPDLHLSATLFRNKTTFPFKQLCGEYPTASGFALWLAFFLISEQKAPDWFPSFRLPAKHILICNHDLNAHHALYLISAC